MLNPKVESACLHKRSKSIAVDANERACINCIWYERYYRESRGNIRLQVTTSHGYCLRHDKKRGPLMQPCREFEFE